MGQIKKQLQIIILDDMIWPILEAELQKHFSSVFGSNENFEICFWD